MKKAGKNMKAYRQKLAQEVNALKPLLSKQEEARSLACVRGALQKNKFITGSKLVEALKQSEFKKTDVTRVINSLMGNYHIKRIPDSLDAAGFKSSTKFALSTSTEASSQDRSLRRMINEFKATYKLADLLEALTDPVTGVNFRKLRKNMQTYEKTATGKEIVAWLASKWMSSEIEALHAARYLVARGILRNVYGKTTLSAKAGKYTFNLEIRSQRPTIRESKDLQLKRKQFGVTRWVQAYVVLEPSYLLVYKEAGKEILLHFLVKEIGK
eukprot:jgi/Bigna1/131606/aug1.15_g6314